MASTDLEQRLHEALAQVEALTEALGRAEARAGALAEHSPDPTFEVDPAGRIVSINSTARHRIPSAEIGMSLAALFEPPGAALVERAFSVGIDDSFDGELRLVGGRIVLLRAVPFSGGGSVVALRDVSERVALREALEQGRREAAIGRIAGGIAHEVNNPLTVLQLRTDLLLEDARMPRDLVRHLELLRESTQRIARTVRSLQRIARPPEPTGGVDLGELVERAVSGARARLEPEVGLDLPADTELFVLGDPESLVLAIEHLVLVAAAAGPTRVTVTATERQVAIAVSTRSGVWPDGVVAGPAEPEAAAPVGGLGLAIAGTIARDHGGELRLAGRPGGGGVLTLSLPRRSRPAPARATPARVLVVDDEPLVASVVADFCRRAGHSVEVATSAEDAMRRLGAGQPIDVVLADDRLPGTSGRELVRWVSRARPELARRVALMSGGAPDISDAPFLPKPFTRRQLQELMDSLLGS